MAAASGPLPTLALAATRQSEETLVLHLAVLTTSTTCSGVVQELVVHWIGT